MQLDELIQGLDITLHDPELGSLRICDISEDSRTALPSSLFVAREGHEVDGHAFIDQAIEGGAGAVLTSSDRSERPCGAEIAWLTTPNVPLSLAHLAERFSGSPSSELKLAGVTGTNGKSTVAALLQQLLDSPEARCGLLGTIVNLDGRGSARSEMTTPPALEISYSLSTMVDSGFHAAALEVSSHGLAQRRAAGLDFDAAIFTNLSGDHLDYHRSMEAYAGAKARLFTELGPDAVAVINADDPFSERIVQDCQARVVRCSMERAAGSDAMARHERWSGAGTGLRLDGPWGTIEGVTPLLGTFNVLNLLLAVATAHELGATREEIQRRIPTLQAPMGRLECMAPTGDAAHAPMVFVDYAHTDDALRQALGALRPLADRTGNQLVVVMGCGGDRDQTKRSRMGRAASDIADVVFVTSDNPRSEDPASIVRDVLRGIEHDAAAVHVEVDRGTAIHRAIAEARAGDLVLIAGKGHEDYQMILEETRGPLGRAGVRRVAFDDRVEARAALARRSASRQRIPTESREVVPT